MTADERNVSAANRSLLWATIVEMHDNGMTVDDIAEQLGVTAGAVDLALQARQRERVTLGD